MRKRKKIKLFFNYKILAFFIFLLVLFYFLFFLSFDIFLDNKKIDRMGVFNFLIYKNILIKDLLEKDPSIIKINFGYDIKNLKIFISTVKENPIAIICSSNCYYLGEHSYIYEIKNEPKNLLKIISYREIYPNSYLESNITNALSIIFENSNIIPFAIKKVFILSNKDIKVETQDFSFLIDPYKDVNQQIKKLTYVLKNYNYLKFNQLDLRISGKIYFK